MFDFFGNNINEEEDNLSRVRYTNRSSKNGHYGNNVYSGYVGRLLGNRRSSAGIKSELAPLFLFLFYFITVFWLEFVLRIAFSSQVFNSGLFTIITFSLPIAAVMFMLSYYFSKKVNIIISIVLTLVLTILFGSQIVYHQIFEVYYTMYQATTQGEALQFVDTIMSSIFKSLGYILLCLIPFAVLCIWGRKRFFDDKKKQPMILLIALLAGVMLQLSAISLLKPFGNEYGTAYNLYYKTMNFNMSVEKLGLFTTMRIDMQRLVFGFEEESGFINNPGLLPSGEAGSNQGGEELPVEYGDNVMDIDFDSLIASAQKDKTKEMHAYFSSVAPTKKNEKTGLFKDCNLIWITAESFSPYVISPELTPTLYKMENEGFKFNNFYSPLWSGSTLAGEYVLCTGLLPKNEDGIRSFKDTVNNNMYFCMGNQLGRLGYTTYAFHNNTYDYYGRNKTHPNMGYKYLGVGNGLKLEHPGWWPQSDVELIDSSVPYFIDSEKFHTYYMTVSGHCNYSYTGNRIASLNRKYLESLNLGYSSTATAFLSCNYELEKAMTRLMEILNEKGIAENTVIVIAPDHYPYELSHQELEELAGHSISEPFETYRSSLLIYKQGMKPETVDTLCSSLDVLPTISNLMGIDYDSRLMAGKDIFSDHEAIVPCPSRNWMTEKATYISNSKKVTSKTGEDIPQEYIDRINNKLNNDFTASRQIIGNDYYNILFGK